MVKLIRHNKAIGYLLLPLILAASKYHLYHTSPLTEGEIPFLLSISGLRLDLDMSDTWQKIWVLLTLAIQGLYLQWVLVRHRFIEHGSPLIPFLYVFAALMLPDHFFFNDGLWINFIILYLVNIILGVYDKESLKDTAFLNIGTFTTVAVLILPSMWLLFPFILLGLSLFVVITDRQIWLVLFSSVMIITLLFSLIYLTGHFDPSAWQHKILPSLPSLQNMDKGAAIVLILMLFIGMAGVMSSIPMLQLLANKVRNQYWSFVLLYLFSLLAIFLYPDTLYFSYQLLVVPFTAIVSFVVLNGEKRWYYESFFILTIWSLFVVGYGYLV